MKYFCFGIFLTLLNSCIYYSEEIAHQLVLAEKIIESRPDSALHILQHIEGQRYFSREQYAVYCLLYTEAMDKTRKKLTSDSLIRVAVDFFFHDPELYPERLAKSLFYQGRAYHDANLSEEAMQLYMEVELKGQALSDLNLLGLVNSEMGHLFQRQNLSKKAIEHFTKSANYFHQVRNFKNEGYALMNMGLNYYVTKKYDSTVFHVQKVRQIAKEACDTALLSQSLVVLGMAYTKLKRPDAVKLYLQECINLPLNDIKLAQAYNSLSDAYLQEEQWETARFYAHKALEKGILIHSIYSQAMSYQCLYFIEKDEENFKKALEYYDKCVYLKDSINTLENRNNVFEIQEKYNAERWKNKTMQLEANQQYARLMLLALALGVVVLVLIFFLHRSRHRQKLLKSETLAIKNETRLKEFLLKRLDVSKELVALMQHPKPNPEKIQTRLHALVDKLTFNAADSEALIATVNELFNGFADKLAVCYPVLTPNDVQLCCMMRAGFDAGIMSTIMGINFDSIYKKRSRLRKKIGLHEKESIEDLLSKI
jgi:tetratricopeptide (TPR) repeat protein